MMFARMIALAACLAAGAAAGAEEVEVGIGPDLPVVTVQTDSGQVQIRRDQNPDAVLGGDWARTSRDCPPFCIKPMVPAGGLGDFGCAPDFGDRDCTGAKEVALFCNGRRCGQSPSAIRVMAGLGQQIAAMQALSGGGTIYLGTAAKALMPGLRLGWMVVPEALVEPMRQAQRNLGLGANIHAQAALADLMAGGHYRAHLRRMARVNAERGEALVAALDARLGRQVQARQPDGGLQLAIRFDGIDREAACQRRLEAAGFAPARLSRFSLGAGPVGLVTGFADAPPDRTRRFVDGLAAALDAPPR